MDAKEEVRARLQIEDVIGEYVALKRAGRNFKGLSPFSNERTPSFYVSPDKNIWHDFSSNKGGDVFSFVMEAEGLDFRQTLELLARKAGVDLSLYESSSSRELATKKRKLYTLLNLATQFYQQSLLKNQHALNYVIRQRGLSKKIVQDFKIGYAPNSFDGLITAVKKRGYSQADLAAAGLSAQRRGGVGDMFRTRMMIPLSDAQGQIVGFTARIIADEPGAPKYINTPQTLLYDKGRQVFGLHLAKEAIRKADKAVIVEGNMDVISSHQAGVANVVAAAGTALTEHHIKSLTRLSANIALAFDADQAGLQATERAIGLAQAEDVQLTIVTLGDKAKDPDELIRQDPKAWQAAIDNSEPVVDWIIHRYTTLYDITTAVGKKQLTSRALAVIKLLRDPVEQEHYLQKLATVSDISVESLQRKLHAKTNDPPKRYKKVSATPAEKPDLPDVYRDNLLALCLYDPDVRDPLRHLEGQDIASEAGQAILQLLQADSRQRIGETLPKELHPYETYVKILLLKAETRYGEWSSQERYQETTKLVRLIKSQQLKTKKQKLIEDLRQAEANGETQLVNDLRNQLNTVIKEQ